jgi:hypothetical protein
MYGTLRRAAREGLEFGACAGLVFTLAQMVVGLVQRRPTFYPLRQLAGLVIDPAAIEHMSTGGILLAGIVVHLVVSAFFGVLYCLLNEPLSMQTQTRWDRQVVIGLLFGVLVWGLKFLVVARYLDLAFAGDRRFLFTQLILHTFFYGVPLSVFYTNAERSLRPLQHALQRV